MISENIFSSRIKALRMSQKLSQTQLAEALGITYGAVSMMESDKRKPSYEVLCALADHFSVSIDYLTGRSDERTICNPIISSSDEEAATI